jgi:hypothetical protein
MLYHIVQERHFSDSFERIKESFWPGKELLASVADHIARLKEMPRINVFYSNVSAQRITQYKFPFAGRYLAFLLKGKLWDCIIGSAQKKVTLEVKDSDNFGNFNHFLNVISALARLIEYFSDPHRVTRIFQQNLVRHTDPPSIVDFAKLGRELCFSDLPSKRSFILMLAGYYHDIGKTIINRRHGLEGSLILSEYTSVSLFQLSEIAKSYQIHFTSQDLTFISDLILFHDIFGTISTGETGYLRLLEVVDSMKRASLILPRIGDVKCRSRRNLFDLWLLNAADIIVSLDGKKFRCQEEWQSRKTAFKRLDEFFNPSKKNPSKGEGIAHDFWVSLKMMNVHNHHKHSDNLSGLKQIAFDFSKRHVVERIRRLIAETVMGKGEKSERVNVRTILHAIQSEMTEDQITSSIVKAICANEDFQTFCDKMAWIGHMDYALGFFEKILKKAMEYVDKELEFNARYRQRRLHGLTSGGDVPEDCERTGWIRDKQAAHLNNSRVNVGTESLHFLQNYCSVIVQIIQYLLVRWGFIREIINLEFSDAQERLTDEKVRQIINLEGPFRFKRSIEVILRTVFVY